MILIAFDVKFYEKKHEIHPRACRPLKKVQKFKKNAPGNGGPGGGSLSGGSGGRSPPGRGKRGVRGAAPPGYHPGF